MCALPSQPAEAYGGPDSPAADTIYECLAKGLDINPDKVALISLHQASDHLADTVTSKGPSDVDCLHWTYRQLNEASLKLATHLVHLCPPGKRRVVSFVWNSIEHAILYWAVAHMRGVFVPLDPTLMDPGREASRDWYIDFLKPDVVVTLNYDNGLERLLTTAFSEAVKISLTPSESMPASWLSLASILRSVNVESSTGTIAHDNLPDSTAAVQILFTSGTTAHPKPIAHSAANMTSSVCLVAHKLHPSVIYMATTPNFRIISLFYLLGVNQAGATLLVPSPYFNAEVAVAAINRCKPHMVGFVPAQMRLISVEASRAGVTLSSIRSVSLSGDVVTSDVVDLARKTFPSARLMPVAGMTEAITMTSWSTPVDSLPSLANNIVSVGVPVAGCVLRICRQGTLEPVERGDVGELWVAGQGLVNSYLDGRDSQHFCVSPDLRGRERRWLCTGDSAMMDLHGHLFVLGRYKDIIVRAGFKLSPTAIEMALRELGSVDVHVVGLPHRLLGSVPVAVVRSLLHFDVRHLIDGVVRMLGKEYQLEHIWTLEDLGLDEWVYNSTGKVSKTDLQHRLLETVVDGCL